MIQGRQLSHIGAMAGVWISGTLLVLTACAKHLEFPPMRTPLPASAKLETSSSLKDLTLRYSDSCGQIQELPLGTQLIEALQAGLSQTFDRVVLEGDQSASPPDHLIQVDLVDSSFELNKEALYDRAPAVFQLSAIARVHDRTGALLRQTDIKIARQERLRLEQLSKNCNYVIDPFIHDATIEFAARVALNARQAAEGYGSLMVIPDWAQLSRTPTISSASDPTSGAREHRSSLPPSTLRFKAMLLDENSDLIFEGGEHVRVRVDVVNTGTALVENASATLTGTPAVIERFPTTVLRIPPLMAGQTKSLEFVATLPLLIQSLQAQVHVSVAELTGSAAPSQTLSFTIAPTGSRGDNVDHVPAQASGMRHPDISVVAIGLSSYADHQIPSRKYASQDAETIAKYFQTLGGVPSSNISLLTDRKATHSKIQKALLEWLPTRPMKNAVVLVYFSGHAMVSPTGEVLLVPYDGIKAAPTLYRLKSIESVLSRLNPQQAILVFDGKVSPIQDNSKTPITPQWELHGDSAIRLIAVQGLGTGIEDDAHQHGLFTYYLLRGLRGEADTNRNGKVTFGELSAFVRQKVAWASKSQSGAAQHPQIIPLLKPDDKAADVVLTTLPSLAASETP